MPANPSDTEILGHLEQILRSPLFAQTQALSALLAYVVENTVKGQTDRIKEYGLGVAVFNRGDDFDPRVDTIVRVQARKLRNRLEEYYQTEGAGDAIRIVLSKGSYVPKFEIAKIQVAESDDSASGDEREARTERRSTARVVAVAALLGCAVGIALGLAAGWRLAPRDTRPKLHLEKVELLKGDPGGTNLAQQVNLSLEEELRRLTKVALGGETQDGLILKGTLQQRGARVLLELQLRSLRHAAVLWSGTYEGERTDKSFVPLTSRAIVEGVSAAIDDFECVHL